MAFVFIYRGAFLCLAYFNQSKRDIFANSENVIVNKWHYRYSDYYWFCCLYNKMKSSFVLSKSVFTIRREIKHKSTFKKIRPIVIYFFLNKIISALYMVDKNQLKTLPLTWVVCFNIFLFKRLLRKGNTNTTIIYLLWKL